MRLRDLDGRLQLARFRARYGRVPERGSASRLGLFFIGPRGEIPTDLCRRLLALTPEPLSSSLPSSADLPEPGPDTDEFEVRMTEQAAAADLATILRVCEAGKLRLLHVLIRWACRLGTASIPVQRDLSFTCFDAAQVPLRTLPPPAQTHLVGFGIFVRFARPHHTIASNPRTQSRAGGDIIPRGRRSRGVWVGSDGTDVLVLL